MHGQRDGIFFLILVFVAFSGIQIYSNILGISPDEFFTVLLWI